MHFFGLLIEPLAVVVFALIICSLSTPTFAVVREESDNDGMRYLGSEKFTEGDKRRKEDATQFLSGSDNDETENKEFIVKFKDKEMHKGFCDEQYSKKNGVGSMNLVQSIPLVDAEVISFGSRSEATTWAESRDDVAYIEENAEVHTTAEDIPYGITMVEALEIGDYVADSGIKVCIIDTGYDLNHEDLQKSNISGGGTCSDNPCHWYEDPGEHGTHVAGTMLALGGNGKGVSGVVRSGTMPVRIERALSGSGGGTWGSVIGAISNCNAAGANVVNMSLGGGFSQVLEDVIKNLENTNDRILFVAAAGNGGNNSYLYPASIDSPIMMSVACVDSSKARCSFSQYNDQVDIAAPGLSVRSTVPGNGTYGNLSGTSMSSPHVAAVAALVWSHFPEKSAFEIRQALELSAIQPNSSQQGNKNDEFGWGIVNAKNALNVLGDGIFTRKPSISPSPTPPPTMSMQPSGPCMPIKIEIFPDYWAFEISWELKDPQGSEITSHQEHDTLSYGVLFEYDMCLGSFCGGSMNYQFNIADSYGDGLSYEGVSGYFAIYADGTRIFGQSDGTNYGYGDEVLIEACDGDNSSAPTSMPSSLPSLIPTFMSSSLPSPVPTSMPSSLPSPVPTSMPSPLPSPVPTSMPSPLPSKSMQPSEPCMPIKIEIIPDKYPKDISWELKDPQGSEITSKQEHGRLIKGVLFEYETCVDLFCGDDNISMVTSDSMNYVFNINDSYGDGLKLGVEDAHFAIYAYGTRIFGQSDGTNFGYGDQVLIEACGDFSAAPTTSVPTSMPSPLPSKSMQPSGPCMPIKIEIIPDKYPKDISWELKDTRGEEIASNQEHGKLIKGVLFVHEMCVGSFCDDSMNYVFNINDRYGDGLKVGVEDAHFAIYAYGTRIFGQSDGKLYGSGDQVLIDACSTNLSSPPSYSPSTKPTISPTYSPTYYDERRCTESEDDEWYLRTKDTNSSLGAVEVLRSCKWLANHKLKSKFCAKDDSSPAGHRPAKDVCRVTCATCDPDPDRCPERNNHLQSTIEQQLKIIARQESEISAYKRLLAENGIEF